ncbi:hypothetical protein [Vagococcus sp. WN89Y]|uniref:hypothetical protein n=1 Tax=Vagococcus sp. WN89Y TaxID=3457258 RepID=UPI003FCEE267
MIEEINKVPFASEDVLEKLESDKEFAVSALDITPTEKIEMVLARLTVSNGEYPTAAVAKQTIQDIGLEIPAGLSELAAPITPEDSTMPYYNLFKD